jgi:hypothetical protein
MFVSLEDGTGGVQVIVWRNVKERLRGPLLRSRLLKTRAGGDAAQAESSVALRRRVAVADPLFRIDLEQD